MSAWSGPAIPFRAQPDVPNAMTGNVTALPRKVRNSRFTVRIPHETLDELPNLRARLDRYAARTQHYTRPRLATRSLVVPEDLHAAIHIEAQRAGMTVNGFISRILADTELTEN